jgi:indolepyruvate ferredoxin oxidoreductase alpha subunit
MKKLLLGNEALALGAYHADVMLAAAYPGTPSTEILETLARFDDIHAEWSTNEKVAMEVALGAAYAGVRALVAMKQVGLNVASDPFMAASITGINGGLVVVSADDPGVHSTQNEQDSRPYAKFAKVPMLEPSDSQEAYDLMAHAFDMSEMFDTPVLLRTTLRVSHSKSVVEITRSRNPLPRARTFHHDCEKYVMLPAHARRRVPVVEERLAKLSAYAESCPLNQIIWGERHLGIITSGIAYHYAREVFPNASFLKLGMTFPLPARLLRYFASQVERVVVIEELTPFLEENIRILGVDVRGKEFIPSTGALNPRIIEEASFHAGLLPQPSGWKAAEAVTGLPERPPVLCAGCPYLGIFFVLSTMGQRSKLQRSQGKWEKELKLIITGDIGCYTLATYPPLCAMDTCACMGASIGQALGIEKAGTKAKVVAVIGDSTFFHSGITGVVNGVYNESETTIIILDNNTTAMTGHQEHPGTGISAQGKKTKAVDLERLVRGIGVDDVKIVNAFDVRALRTAVRDCLSNPELSVLIVRGRCSSQLKQRFHALVVDAAKCDRCQTCLKIGCPAIQKKGEDIYIESTLCVGEACTICEQICPTQAIKRPSTESGQRNNEQA